MEVRINRVRINSAWPVVNYAPQTSWSTVRLKLVSQLCASNWLVNYVPQTSWPTMRLKHQVCASNVKYAPQTSSMRLKLVDQLCASNYLINYAPQISWRDCCQPAVGNSQVSPNITPPSSTKNIMRRQIPSVSGYQLRRQLLQRCRPYNKEIQ